MTTREKLIKQIADLDIADAKTYFECVKDKWLRHAMFDEDSENFFFFKPTELSEVNLNGISFTLNEGVFVYNPTYGIRFNLSNDFKICDESVVKSAIAKQKKVIKV